MLYRKLNRKQERERDETSLNSDSEKTKLENGDKNRYKSVRRVEGKYFKSVE